MSIRKDKASGVYFVDFRAPDGSRIRGSTKTRERQAAQEYHDKLKADLWRQSMLGDVPDRVFEDGAKHLIEMSAGQRDYRTKLRHLEYWHQQFSGRSLRSLTVDDIIGALPTHSVAKYGKSKPLSGATKNRYLATIIRMLSLCAAKEWIDKVPKIPKYWEAEVRVRWEPPEVIKVLIGALRLGWMRDAALTAVATGMRQSELFGLKPNQIYLDTATAHITHDQAKSKQARSIPLNEDAMSVLKRRMESARRYVFTRDTGAEVDVLIREPDKRDWLRACKAAGIEDFHWHDLRHTWASWHVQRGTPLLVLKELGGWETIEMVQKYAHLAPSHMAAHADTVKFWSSSSAQEKTPLVRAA